MVSRSRILVTGGAGFIGSHVVDRLLDDGHDVAVLDNLSPDAHDGPPDYLDRRADLRVVDLTDQAAVDAAVAGVDAVCHQGARVGLGVDGDDVVSYVTDNDLGTAVLLRALWRRNFSGRLVVASSMVVYGEGAYRCRRHGTVRPGPRSEEDLSAGRFEPACVECGRPLEPALVDENAVLDPRNTYAATKLHTEHLASIYGREAGAPVLALRYHNVYGDRMPADTPYAGVASIFRSSYEAGRAPQLFEDGRQRRDFVHVDDVARANVLALTASPHVTGACNIASGTPHTIGDLAAALAAAYGPATPAAEVSGRWRLGDVRHVTASTARAEEVLGFRAERSFTEGVAGFATAALRRPPRRATPAPAR
jgi:dTDP-L-rhamnose 4-epimerase